MYPIYQPMNERHLPMNQVYSNLTALFYFKVKVRKLQY